jgi:hypothetical protein
VLGRMGCENEWVVGMVLEFGLEMGRENGEIRLRERYPSFCVSYSYVSWITHKTFLTRFFLMLGILCLSCISSYEY